MCGLVGIFGNVQQEEKAFFKTLLQLDVSRGRDSSGIARITEDNQADVIKSVGVPSELYKKRNQEFDENNLIMGDNLKCLIGHNRFKTQGDVSDEFAHPFEFDNVIGAHNGTIAQYQLRDLGKYPYPVDSQHIYASLNDHVDPQDTWGNIADTQSSAAALTWWDKRTNTLNIIRNSQRPLFCCVDRGLNTVRWASESWMLKAAIFLHEVDVDKIEEVETHTLHTFSFKDGKVSLKKRPLKKKEATIYSTTTQTGYKTGTTTSNTNNHTQKRVTLKVREVMPNVHVPHIILTHGEKEVICLHNPTTADPDFFELLYAHMKLFKNSGIEVNEYSIYNRLINNKPELAISTYSLEKVMKDDMEGLFGSTFTIDKLREYLEVEREVEEKLKKAAEEQEKTPQIPETPPKALFTNGEYISGKSFRKALRAVGNVCSCCGEEFFPKTPGASGGFFITNDEFICKPCCDQFISAENFPQTKH